MSGGWLAVAAVGGALIASQATKVPKYTSTPTTPPPQASKAPDASTVASSMSGAGQAGGAPGAAQTLLTGAGGIDPGTLNLGKKVLLGG